jgi:hypothetical protein
MACARRAYSRYAQLQDLDGPRICRNLMPKVRAFVDFLATTFRPEPPWEQGWTLPD